MQVKQGLVHAQRFFDVADEIDLLHAERLVAGLSRRPRFVGRAQQIMLPDPPLEMAIGPRPTWLANMEAGDVTVRIHNVGTVTVSFLIPLPSPIDAEALVRFGARILDAHEELTNAARPIRDEIVRAIAPACRPGDEQQLTEDYTVFVINETTPQTDADHFARHVDVARLLLGEPSEISEAEREHLTRTRHSYFPDELVVIDWNSALVLDPRNNSEVPALLELATAQLLNLRAYDGIVGRALDRLYDELERVSPARSLMAATRYQRLSRQIMKLFVDVADTTDRIDNALRFLGDTWLTRVHRAAVEEFDIPRWQAQLQNKMNVLQQINEHLVDQITTRRGLSAEYAIIVLIIIEILFALPR